MEHQTILTSLLRMSNTFKCPARKLFPFSLIPKIRPILIIYFLKLTVFYSPEEAIKSTSRILGPATPTISWNTLWMKIKKETLFQSGGRVWDGSFWPILQVAMIQRFFLQWGDRAQWETEFQLNRQATYSTIFRPHWKIVFKTGMEFFTLITLKR